MEANKYSGSKSSQRKIHIGRNFILLEFFIITLFTILRFSLSLHSSLYIHIGIYLIMLVQLVLYRLNFYSVFIVFSLLAFNLVVFLLASSESSNTGMWIHFISTATAALTFFGYEEWGKSVFFITLSLVLFLLLHLTSISILPMRLLTPGEEKIFFSIHLFTMAFASVSCIFILLRMNSDAEKSLIHNQVIITSQNEELKKANSELDRFVYSASHDLRAPLSSISGLAKLVQYGDQAATAEYMRLIQERVEAMNKFIGEIIDYSRNSRVEVEYKPIRLKSLVEEVWKSLNHFEGSDKVKLEIELDPEFTLATDPYRMRVILNNLLTNAIKYADPHKEPSVRISSRQHNGQLDILLEDNGVGIDPEHHGRVFDMFYRASERSTGSGLGLYIVSEAIRKMNGNIRMNSELGVGTAFTISLPNPH